MTKIETLKKIDVLQNAGISTLNTLVINSSVKKYKKGEHLFYEKDEVVTLFGIVSGVAELYKMSTTNDKRGIFIYGSGALLNEVVLDGKNASINVLFLRDSEILCIPKDAFLKVCATDFELSKAVFNSMSMKIRRLYHLMKNTSNNLRGDRRIAAKLWKLSRDFGEKTERGTEINFDLSITLLADYLGSQRETVSRQVKTLVDAGLVIVENNRFILPNREKLLRYFENS